MRASDAAGPGGDVFAQLKPGFESVAMGKVSTSAFEAKRAASCARRRRSWCSTASSCCTSRAAQARALADGGYRPPCPRAASRSRATSASRPSRCCW